MSDARTSTTRDRIIDALMALAACSGGEGAAPTTPRQSLSGGIRPRLDTLQTSILQSLRDAAPARSQADCPLQIAQEIGRVAREKSLDTLHRIALDRATARLCVKS